jgi:8-hydroxy-5-deazaflavin:NADPH oxidoreductase
MTERSNMNIGILGSGMIGATAARLFAQQGHAVAISNRRGPASLAGLVAEIGPHARAATVDEAAAFGEAVLLAIPFGEYQTIPAAPLAGKIAIDAMNYYPQRDGSIDFAGRSSSELVASHLADARVVKAFNTMYFKLLGEEGSPAKPLDERFALFVAGDDAEAKAVVERLIEETGFAAIDTGTLHDGGLRQQPGSPIYNHPLRAPEARAAVAKLR